MKILYYIYQICIALPILLVLTILTAVVTIVGSLLGGAHIWGYYPGKIWSQLICLFLLIPVKVHGREKLHERTSYIFVPNHQGSFDIFLIYGFLGRNFKWMMKKSLRKIPFVGKACESAGHIFVDRSGPKKVLETIRPAPATLDAQGNPGNRNRQYAVRRFQSCRWRFLTDAPADRGKNQRSE